MPTPDNTPDDNTLLLREILSDLRALKSTVAEVQAHVEGQVKEYYTVDEAAAIVGRAPYTVRTWIREGRLKAQRVAGTGDRGRFLIARDDLIQLVGAGRTGNASRLAISDNRS